MHYLGDIKHSPSMTAFIILTSISGNPSEKLHYGSFVYMPYSLTMQVAQFEGGNMNKQHHTVARNNFSQIHS